MLSSPNPKLIHFSFPTSKFTLAWFLCVQRISPILAIPISSHSWPVLFLCNKYVAFNKRTALHKAFSFLRLLCQNGPVILLKLAHGPFHNMQRKWIEVVSLWSRHDTPFLISSPPPPPRPVKMVTEVYSKQRSPQKAMLSSATLAILHERTLFERTWDAGFRRASFIRLPYLLTRSHCSWFKAPAKVPSSNRSTVDSQEDRIMV